MPTMPYIPTALADFYKLSHPHQYPEKTEIVYSNFTPRGTRIPGVDKVVFFGLQAFVMKWMVEYFNTYFFSRNRSDVAFEYRYFIYYTLINPGNSAGLSDAEQNAGIDAIDDSLIRELHDYGKLPITIKALPEGTLTPLRVPMYTVENSFNSKDDRFFWVTNYFETAMSSEIWGACNSATIAYEYKKILTRYADATCDDRAHVPFQAHDFSLRGMFGIDAGTISGMGHLTSFVGTDTAPAIQRVCDYYFADISTEIVGTSIPATEHSVMCAHGNEDERAVIDEFITKRYPSGFLSIVSDTWDFWKLVTEAFPSLKAEIMGRDGRTVIRPDSGDPVLIVTGDPNASTEHERKGLIACLWDTFGGTVNSKGYKVLDPHIGAIYGDGITLERAEKILSRLEEKGFAASNIVFGVGSFTYQYNTRDTFMFAVKSTYVQIDGVGKAIQKDPKTDDGTKKSAKGKVIVWHDGNDLRLIDGMNEEQYQNMSRRYTDCLQPVMVDGELVRKEKLSDVRALIDRQLEAYLAEREG